MPEILTIALLDSSPFMTVLQAQGIMDAKTTPALIERCQAAKSEGQNLVLDLSRITFIASSGIGGLLALAEEFTQAGLNVRFAALSQAVASVVQLLNLDGFLNIDDSVSEATDRMAA